MHKKYPNYIGRYKDDLMEAGRRGIYIAFLQFDISKNTKFSTFAYDKIYAEMSLLIYQEIGKCQSPYYGKLIVTIKKAIQICLENGLPLNVKKIHEIVKKIDPSSRQKSLSTIRNGMIALQILESILYESAFGNNYAFYQMNDNSAEDYTYKMELHKAIETALRSLTKEERYIVELKIGYNYDKELSCQKIADKMNRSGGFKRDNYTVYFVKNIYSNAMSTLSHSPELKAYYYGYDSYQ